MGRIKGTLVKRTTKALMSKYKGRFAASFTENKKVLAEVMPGMQKKIRNSVAGFIARKVKSAQEQGKKK